MRLSKAQVAMFVIIALLIVGAILLAVAAYYSTKDQVEQEVECHDDRDCIKVQTTCCSCSQGGDELCVSKDVAADYKIDMDTCPDDLVCTQVDNCGLGHCLCVRGSCTSVRMEY